MLSPCAKQSEPLDAEPVNTNCLRKKKKMATASTILTTTAASTAVVGMREELGDIVSVMDPAETPFVLARHRLDAEHDHARVADHHPAQRAPLAHRRGQRRQQQHAQDHHAAQERLRDYSGAVRRLEVDAGC